MEKWEKDLWKQTKKFLNSLDKEYRVKFVGRLYATLLTAENNRSVFGISNREIIAPIKRWCRKIVKLQDKDGRTTH